MTTFLKTAAFAATVLLATSATQASAGPRHVLKRVPGGPRPDQYVWVRTSVGEQRDQPYALTGTAPAKQRKAVSWPTRTHPKGTHGH
jgi:hypothetical protein